MKLLISLCLIGMSAAVNQKNQKVWRIEMYKNRSCTTKMGHVPGYGKDGVFTYPMDVCLLTSVNAHWGNTWTQWSCVNDTAAGSKTYNNSACTSQYLKSTKVVDSSLPSTCGGSGQVAMMAIGKCGGVMDCSLNATLDWHSQYYDCNVSTSTTTTSTTTSTTTLTTTTSTTTSTTASTVKGASATTVAYAFTITGSLSVTLQGTATLAEYQTDSYKTVFKQAIVAQLGNGVTASDVTVTITGATTTTTVAGGRRLQERRLAQTLKISYSVKTSVAKKAAIMTAATGTAMSTGFATQVVAKAKAANLATKFGTIKVLSVAAPVEATTKKPNGGNITNITKKASADATAMSATAGLVISALALCV